MNVVENKNFAKEKTGHKVCFFLDLPKGRVKNLSVVIRTV